MRKYFLRIGGEKLKENSYPLTAKMLLLYPASPKSLMANVFTSFASMRAAF